MHKGTLAKVSTSSRRSNLYLRDYLLSIFPRVSIMTTPVERDSVLFLSVMKLVLMDVFLYSPRKALYTPNKKTSNPYASKGEMDV
jgi:hypothetical protein